MICRDLKKSDNRPYKVSPNTDVSAAEIGQICWLIVDLYISLSHLNQNKGNLDLISFIFDRNFPVFCPKRMIKKNGFAVIWYFAAVGEAWFNITAYVWCFGYKYHSVNDIIYYYSTNGLVLSVFVEWNTNIGWIFYKLSFCPSIYKPVVIIFLPVGDDNCPSKKTSRQVAS